MLKKQSPHKISKLGTPLLGVRVLSELKSKVSVFMRNFFLFGNKMCETNIAWALYVYV